MERYSVVGRSLQIELVKFNESKHIYFLTSEICNANWMALSSYSFSHFGSLRNEGLRWAKEWLIEGERDEDSVGHIIAHASPEGTNMYRWHILRSWFSMMIILPGVIITSITWATSSSGWAMYSKNMLKSWRLYRRWMKIMTLPVNCDNLLRGYR